MRYMSFKRLDTILGPNSPWPISAQLEEARSLGITRRNMAPPWDLHTDGRTLFLQVPFSPPYGTHSRLRSIATALVRPEDDTWRTLIHISWISKPEEWLIDEDEHTSPTYAQYSAVDYLMAHWPWETQKMLGEALLPSRQWLHRFFEWDPNYWLQPLTDDPTIR